MIASERHWPEYAMEGALLGLFMIAACIFAAALEHPASPLRQALSDGNLRRLIMCVAIGATAVTLVRSPWGQQSGGHMNPSLTLTYFRLGKVHGVDALGYVASQFAGGLAGVLGIRLVLGRLLAHPLIRFAATADRKSVV